MRKTIFIFIFVILAIPNSHAQPSRSGSNQTTITGYLNNGGELYSGSPVLNIQPQSDNINYSANWTQGTNMPAPTRYHGSGCMWVNPTKDTAKLFCIGGDLDGSGNTSNLVNIYNLTTNSWSLAPPVSAGRFYPFACCAGDSVYFLGGIGGTGGLFTQEVNTVDIYNVRTNTMTLGPVLPNTYADARALPYQDSIIYIVGGLVNGTYNATANVYLFNRRTNTYRAATPLPVARSSFAGVIVGDTIYVVCGGPAYGFGSNTMYIGAINSSNHATIMWTTGMAYPGTSTQRIYAEKWGCKGFIIGCGSTSGFNESTECYVYNTNIRLWQYQIPASTPTSAYFSGSAPVGTSGITKWVVASGLYNTPPFSIPNVQIYTDSLYCLESLNSLCEGFNSTTFPPVGWNLTWYGGNFWSRQPQSGYNLGSGSARYNSWNAPQGFIGRLISRPFYPTVTGDSLMFDYAYCPSYNSNDELLIQTSTDNGTSWNTILLMTTYDLTTTTNCNNNEFTPSQANDWRTKSISLPPGTNKITFEADNDFGNDIWVDSICLNHLVGGKQNYNVIPLTFSLSQNYPNPFNPSTKIKFDIASNGKREMSNLPDGKAGVKLVIYDLLGCEVATLVNEKLQPGTYEVEWSASAYSSGVYFYKLEISDPETSSGLYFSETRKMVLIK